MVQYCFLEVAVEVVLQAYQVVVVAAVVPQVLRVGVVVMVEPRGYRVVVELVVEHQQCWVMEGQVVAMVHQFHQMLAALH